MLLLGHGSDGARDGPGVSFRSAWGRRAAQGSQGSSEAPELEFQVSLTAHPDSTSRRREETKRTTPASRLAARPGHVSQLATRLDAPASGGPGQCAERQRGTPG